MRHVVDVADQAGRTSGDVLSGAANISHDADQLRNEIDRFVQTIRSEAGERRCETRLAGGGTRVTLHTPDRRGASAMLLDLSRGGATLACERAPPVGAAIELELPDAGGTVTAHVVRSDGRDVAVVFADDPTIIERIDHVLGALTPLATAA